MKTNSIRYNAIWCLLLTLFVVVSCKNDTAIEPVYDGIKMRVSLTSGFEQPIGNSGVSKSKASISGATKNTDDRLETQTQIIPLSNGLNIVAKLVPEQQAAPVALRQSAGGLKAAAQEVRDGLSEGTRYRLLVYDANGNEVKRIEKTVDANSSSFDEFTLDATGTTTNYTFVAYSAGTAALPNLAANTPLANALVEINAQKFMHYVETVGLAAGNNDLTVVLKNKLSEITTVLDGTGIGLNSITGVGNVVFKNATHGGGTIKLSDGVITYTGSAQDKAVTFPTISTALTEVNSSVTALLRSSTTTATLEVEYIEIAGLGRSEPFSVSNVKIEPGVKYNLVLELDKGNCMFEVQPESFSMDRSVGGACRVRFYLLFVNFFTWYDYGISQGDCSGGTTLLGFVRDWRNGNQMGNANLDGQVIGRTYEFAPTANAGVVMNITSLDNSFNMAINEPTDEQNTTTYKIATKEIQFQGTGTNGRNIRFTNGGGEHGVGSVSAIHNITNGTVANPVIRVSISASGVVSIEGRKSNSDLNLYPMELFNSTSFNNVTWLTSGNTNNKVTITQTIAGQTYINGQVTGKRIAPCN